VRQGRLKEAEDWFEAGFARGFVGPGPLSWYLEAAYRLGDFDKLHYAVEGFGEELLTHDGVSERLKDVVRLWLGQESVPTAPQGDMRLA